MNIDLKQIFSKQEFIRTLNELPKASSPVLDALYKTIKKIPSPVIPVAELHTDIRAVGVTTRGGNYLNLAGADSMNAKWIEVFPIRIKQPLDGVTINNLKMLDAGGIKSFRTQKIESLRNTVRTSTELQAVQALKGQIDIPVITDDGSTAQYTVEFGNTETYTISKAFNATDVSIESIVKDLMGMSKIVKRSGYGDIEFWAGEDVYFDIFAVISALPNDTRTKVRVEDGVIITPAGKIILRNEEIFDPKTKAMRPTVASNELACIAKNAPFVLAYAAIDDLDSGLVAEPMFIKPVKHDEQGHKLLCESKPLPAPVTKAICWATGVHT